MDLPEPLVRRPPPTHDAGAQHGHRAARGASALTGDGLPAGVLPLPIGGTEIASRRRDEFAWSIRHHQILADWSSRSATTTRRGWPETGSSTPGCHPRRSGLTTSTTWPWSGGASERDEAKHLTVAIAPGMGRDDQLVSGWFWAALGSGVGFVLFFVPGLFLEFSDVGRLATATLVGLCGALGGGAIGVVYGLARGPELAGAGRDAPVGSVLSVESDALDPTTKEVLDELISDDPVASVWVSHGTPEGGGFTDVTSDHPRASTDGSNPTRRRAG